MEERPRQPSENRNESEDDGYDDKANPGEVFLKKWMGLAEKSQVGDNAQREKEKSRFTQSFKNAVFPRVVSKEATASVPEDEILYDRTVEAGIENAEETQFDKRHEIKNSRPQDNQTPVSTDATFGALADDDNDEPPEMHHISSVIGERAKNIRSAKKQEAEGDAIGKNTKTRSTKAYYLRPVSIGFFAAIAVLLLIIIVSLLA